MAVNKVISVNIPFISGESLRRALLARLDALLTDVGWRHEIRSGAGRGDRAADATVVLRPADGRQVVLLVEVKRELRPGEFPGWAARREDPPRAPRRVSLLAMPVVSPRIADLCRSAGWSWLDLAGNCRIDVPGLLHIERAGEPPVRSKSRPVGSLRSAAAARVLRALLSPAHAGRSWTQRDLRRSTCARVGTDAPVSLGLVNKVLRHLGEEGFIEDTDVPGVRVRDASGLLAAWRAAYDFDRHERRNYFTLLKGARLAEALDEVGLDAGGRAAYAAFSAAERQAPHVRQGKTWLYVDARSLDAFARRVEAKEVESGENVVVLVPEDAGVFLTFDADAKGGDRGLGCTDPVQTYVDLAHCGGRGEEAAEALLEQRILPAWKAVGRA